MHAHIIIHTHKHPCTQTWTNVLKAHQPLHLVTYYAEKAFSVVDPSAWKDLPFELQSLLMAHLSKFYTSLKYFFFVRDWAGSASE